MERAEIILDGYSDLEKGAYLGAIASLATADRVATEEEKEYLRELCQAANLSGQQKEFVIRAATEITEEDLDKCLDILKHSELRYSLVTDLIAFGKSDENYSEEEEKNVKKIADYLGVGEKQFSLLDQFADKAGEAEIKPEETGDNSFLSSLGLNEKLQKAGINPGSLIKGLLGIAGPMILASLLNGRRRSSSGLGGAVATGGLGSIIGMLSGGRGLGSTGGILGKILGKRF